MAKKTQRKKIRPRWTIEEVRILRKMYRSHSNLEIAKKLGRKISSVVFKGFHMGLCKGQKRLAEMGRENIAIRWGKKRNARKLA